MSVSGQVHQGLRWGSAAIATTYVVRLLSTAVLARLLTPELFGVVAMAHVAIEVIGVLRQVGLYNAYVQRIYDDPEDERRAVSTMFVLSSGLNLVLFLLIFLAAPWIASFFQVEQVASILRWLVAGLIIESFLTTPHTILRKRLALGVVAQAGIVGALTRAALGISAALAGLGVWSLVVGHLGSLVVHAGFLAWRARWRPSLALSWGHARQLFGYGKYLWAFAIVSAIGDSLDRLVIGRSLGAASLGVYGLAFNLGRLPSRLITNLVNQVSFPAFAKLQRDLDALRQAFLKAFSHVYVMAMPIGIGIIAVANDLILTVYGDQWVAAIPVVQVLALYGTALSVASVSGPVFQALGRPKVLLYTSLVHHTILITMLLLLAQYGIVAIAWAILVPMISSTTIALTLVVRYLELPARTLLDLLLRGGAASAAMWLAIRTFDTWLDATLAWPAPLSLAASVAVGVASYGLATAVLNRAAIEDVLRTLRRVLLGGLDSRRS